jgi:hypothetical protein
MQEKKNSEKGQDNNSVAVEILINVYRTRKFSGFFSCV